MKNVLSLIIGIITLLLISCQSISNKTPSKATKNVNHLYIVDCLLPGKIKKLGRNITYLEARKAIKTVASDCEIRGGEYTAYDRSNYASALRVWLPLANEGDAKAQTYVGQIYEKGKTGPDYALAKVWYEKAAKQGFSQAQISLGYLYEQGLGVEKDLIIAVNYYRLAGGLNQDVELQLGASQKVLDELESQHADLQDQLAESLTIQRQQTLQLLKLRQKLQRQLEKAKKEGNDKALSKIEQALQQKNKEYRQAQQKLEQVQKKLLPNREKTVLTQAFLDSAPVIELIDPPLIASRGMQIVKTRSILKKPVMGRVRGTDITSIKINNVNLTLDKHYLFFTEVKLTQANTPIEIEAIDNKGRVSTVNFTFSLESSAMVIQPFKKKKRNLDNIPKLAYGKYYALIIGNNNYQFLPKLDTAINDATYAKQLLEQNYAFEVTLLIDANRYEILSKLNALRQKLTKNDNFLLYYAGHGQLDAENRRGYWLPIDAEAKNTANWIKNVDITDILNVMSAKHGIIIADSCYSGAFARASLIKVNSTFNRQKSKAWLKNMIAKRSRTALTSGGLSPVLDGGGGKHSVFAQAFFRVLENNEEVMDGHLLHNKVSEMVMLTAASFKIEQIPEYAPVKFAGHEAGDFFFVPR